MGVRLFACDVDGVLTDGGIYLDMAGRWALKRCDFRDVMGLSIAQRLGMRVAVLSAQPLPRWLRKSLDVRRLYGRPVGAPVLKAGVRDKKAELARLARRLAVPQTAVAYMGDDLNDLAAMAWAGLSLAPADAAPEARRAADWVLKTPGGRGAVREAVDRIARRDHAQAYARLLSGYAEAKG